MVKLCLKLLIHATVLPDTCGAKYVSKNDLLEFRNTVTVFEILKKIAHYSVTLLLYHMS